MLAGNGKFTPLPASEVIVRNGIPAWLALRLVLLSLVACSHAKGAKAGEGDVGPGMTEKVHGDESVKAFDLNGDGKPDAWEYYQQAKGEGGVPAERLVRKEFDLNLDGKVDCWRWYNENEALVKESLDLDFNGTVDVTDYFEKGQLVKKERDFDAAGHAHTWVYYEKNQIARKERDLHNTGKADYWEFWENGSIDRIGFDRDGDGKVDFWERAPEAAAEK